MNWPVFRWGLIVLLLAGAGIRPHPALGQSQIQGRVVDATTADPLPGANVFIQGQLYGTATNDQGRFTLTNLPSERFTLVVSVVGYQAVQKRITPSALQTDDVSNIRFELRPEPIEMTGVTVEGSREEWLERLDDFRDSFFGTAPNSDACSFVNPEVLSFEEKGSILIAHAAKPLRVRNEALGYELTFHLPRYEAAPGHRARHGPVEIDTLRAESPAQRAEWAENRRETYHGSYEHFLDALAADELEEEGFYYWISDDVMWSAGPGTPDPTPERRTDAGYILRQSSLPEHAILVVPNPDDHIKVRYVRERESYVYVRQHRPSRRPNNNQTSALRLLGGRRLIIHLQSGGAANGRIIQRGYWGWYETASTVLPYGYDPSETQ